MKIHVIPQPNRFSENLNTFGASPESFITFEDSRKRNITETKQVFFRKPTKFQYTCRFFASSIDLIPEEESSIIIQLVKIEIIMKISIRMKIFCLSNHFFIQIKFMEKLLLCNYPQVQEQWLNHKNH